MLGPDFWIPFFVVRLHNVLKKRYSYVSRLFSILTCFFLCHIYVIYLFDVITFFDDTRIKLYFDLFELHMNITLKLSFFTRYCNVFL